MECSYRQHEILPAQNSRINEVYVSRGIVEIERICLGGRHAAKPLRPCLRAPFSVPKHHCQAKIQSGLQQMPHFFRSPPLSAFLDYKLSFIVFRIVKNNFCAFAFKLERNVELIFERGFDGGLFFRRDVKE